MFSLNKRFVAILLIFAMTISNAGMSTLAVSISHYVDSANQNAKDDSDITYRYYEEYRYSYESRTTLLMNNDSEDELKEDVEENETEYAEELEEDESEMSESEESESEESESEESESEESESETSESETSESETDESIESEESTTAAEEPTEQSEEETTTTHSEESTHSSEIEEPDIASASDIEVNEETLEPMMEDEIEIAISSEVGEKLFGTTGGTHTHKVCGLSAQPCTHIDMASHTENIEWEEFPTSIAASQVNDYLNGTTGNLGQYIFLSDDLTLTDNAISARRDIYICLNGHSIIGGFADSRYKVVITNCQNSVGTICNIDNNYIFAPVNAEVYGLEFSGVKNINIKGSRYINANVNSAKNIYIYNAKFVKYESSSGNSYSAISIGNYTGKKTLTLEKVEFEGSSNTNYRNPYLVDIDGDNDNSILNLRDITINNYNSVEDCFINMFGGTVTFNGENTISNSKNSTGVIYLGMGILNVASGKTTIKGNTISGNNLVALSDAFTVEKGATLNIEDNKVNFSNNHQEVILFNRNTKLLGNVNIVNNKVVSASGTSTRIYSAVRLGASSNITVGTGSIVIKNNGIYSDAAGTTKYNGIKYYELYSQATDNSTAIFVQNAGTKFSKDSFIDGIAFAHANGFGIIMKNWTTNAEDPDGFTSKLLADTYNRSTLKTVMDGDDLVINDGYFVEFMYDAVTYAGIATQSIIVNGKVSKVASPSDPTGQGGEFFGWATKPNARKKDVINFDTFVITKDTKLYATFEKIHIHKVCGLSTQSCTHIDMASHSKSVRWEEFPTDITASQVNNYLNGTSGGLGQYIFLSNDLTLTSNTITLSRDIYICLNGHSIIGTFGSSASKVVITNCKNSVGTIGNFDSTVFDKVNAEVYGLEFSGVKNINIKGAKYIDANVNSAKNIYIYNAKFVKYESTTWNDDSAISIQNSTGKKTVTLEKVEFEGPSNTNYRNSYLIYLDGNNDNSILNLRDITINNYNSLNSYFIIVFAGTVTFNGENTISNSKNDTGVICDYGILNVASGKTTIKGNTINSDKIVVVRTFTLEKGATLNIEDNKLNFSTMGQRVIDFGNTNTKLLGNVNIVNNKIVSASGTPIYFDIYSAVRLAAGINITVGTGSIVIKNNGIYSDAAGTIKYNGIKYYELYSEATDNSTAIFVQNAGTKFSKDSFIDGIGFAHANGFGIIMKNWTTNAEDPDNYETQLVADTYNRSTLKTIMDGDDLVIKDVYFVEFMYDAVTYAGIATQTIIVNGKVSKVASPSDPTGQGRKFVGWATKSNARKKDVINFDTFVITEDTKLYATFEKIHIHKVCGLSTLSCTHVDMASHSETVRWEEFPTDITASQVNDYLNGTIGDLGKYIFLDDDLTLTGNTITLSRDIYICLNGHSIIGTFAASTYKVVITNCKNSVGTIGNFNSTVFTALNAEVYGLEFGGVKNINIKGSRYIDANVNSAKNIYIYNAKFVKYESNSGNYQDAIYIANSTGKKIVTLEKVEFEGSSNTNYKNDCLIELDGNNDNSILNLRDITINNYNSVESYFISVGYGTVTLNGENTISNSKNILSSSTTGGLIYANYGTVNVASGKTTIKGNTIKGYRLVTMNNDSSFIVEKGATLNIEDNKVNFRNDINQGVILFDNINTKLLGNVNIVNNKIVSASGTSDRVYSAVRIGNLGTTKNITVGTGSIVIKNNGIYSDEEGTTKYNSIKYYELFSYNTAEIFVQNAGTKFSKDSFIDGIAFVRTNYGFGTIMKNWTTNAEDPDNYETQLVADTYNRSTLKTVMDGDDLVINDGYFEVTFKSTISEVQKKLATQSIAYGKLATEPEVSYPDFIFNGWFEDQDYTKAFDFKTAIKKNWTLYAKFEKKSYNVVFISTLSTATLPKRSTKSVLYKEKVTAISVESTDKYKFIGWFTTEGRTEEFDFNTDIEKDTYIYAKWEVIKYVITYKSTISEAQSKLATKSVIGGERAEDVRVSIEGYTFEGWYTDETYTNKFDFNTAINEDKTLYAKFNINKYSVVFVSTLSSAVIDPAIRTQEVEYMSTPSEPKVSHDEFDFDGWFTTATYTTKYDFTKGIVEDTTIYAKWTRKIVIDNYYISFSKNQPVISGETISIYGIMNPQIATVGKTIRLSENKYYNDQVEFVGWSKIALPVSTGTHEEALELIDYEDNAEVKDLAAKDQTITLYAVWRSKVHMATLDAAGGEFDSGESSTQIKVIEDEYINLTMPLRRGYAFTGWTVDGASFTESKYIYDTDKTFVATWEPITFYVRYDGNHSDNDSLESMASVKVSFDEAYKLKVNEFIKNGYTFESWIFDNKEYSEDQTLADIIETMDIVQDQVLVFTAKWGPNEYTINYNNNGGSGTMNSSHPKFGTAFTLPEKTFTNGTKTFLGWNTDKDATKALYSDKASINPEVYAAVIDLYAIWYEETENTGKLTIDGNGGLVNGASSYTIMGELGDVLELPNLEREGHKLVGFTENGNPYIVPDVFDFTGEKTIKATWSEILYNIIYNSNDGKDVTKVVNDVRYNQVVTIIGSISETAGKIFESWNTDNLYNGTTYTEGQNVSQLSKVDGSDVNLYAKYKNHKVTITYDANTGSGTMNPVTYENNTDAYLEANVFTKANNSFIGWSRDKDAKAAEYKDGHRVDDITLTDDNVTLFAIWTAKDAERFIIYDAKGGKVNGKATDKVTVASGSTIIHPTPVYEGYKFNHWLDEDGNVYTKTIVDFDKEITLYADWTEGTYTLRYNGNGNTSGSMADEPVLYTSVHTLRNNTYGKNGYKFAGWDVSANATAVAFKNLATVSKLAKVDEVANIYAVWEGKEYKVVYNANGGDGTVATTSFVYGKNAILSENKFTKVGEVPKGWIYKSPTGDVEITSLVVPSTTFVIDDSTEVITLYANFAGKQMTATLDANGGKFSNDETTKTYSVKKGSVIAFEEATRTGYNLLGYTLDGALFKDATWNLPDSKTFIASWSAITYKIKFNGNGADNADAMGTQEFTYDKTEKLSKNKFEKTGYTFAGWKYDGEDYADEADILNITTKDNDELTFTANWTAKTFRINYDGNTHDGGETMAPTDGAYGKDVQLRKNAFTKKDYVFTGWAKTADGEAVYADLATISALEPYEATRTLYAKWIASKSVAAKIIVKGNGGLVNNAAEATLFLKDGQTITEPTKARTGYKFTEWTTLDGAKYEFPEICDFEGEVTIRANWTPITYYVVYRSNNSENKVATKSMAYDEEGTIMTNPWTYEGYNFDTWSTVKTGNGESFAEGSTYKNLSTVDGSVFDLYARWNGRQITINYNGNGSTYGTMASKTYTYGESSKLEENVFTKGQHTFGGWATSETGTAKYINRNDVDPIILAETSPLTLYAVWISNDNVITIGYNGNGGTISGETVVSKNVEKGSAFEILEAKRDGYTHTGYVNENKEPFTAGQIINVSTVAYATWTENTYTLTYDGKGNTHGSMASKDSLYTAEFNLAENNYRKLGYNFLGWDTDEAGATVVYADKATVSKLAKSGEIKLYAVWSPKTYKVVYNANGASGVVATTSFVYGQTANLAKNTFDKEFNEPAGWIYRKSDGSEVKYASEAPVAYDEFEYSIDSDIITLYANFSKKTYIATLKANGGKFSNGNTEKEVSIKKDDIMSFEEPTRDGYIFDNYYIDGAKIGSTWNYDGNKDVVASWSAIKYRVRFDGNGADNADAMGTQEFTYDKSVKLNENKYTKDGFTFGGWKYNSATYADKADILNLTTNNGAELTFYAIWTGKTVTINYNGNGHDGRQNMSPTTAVYGNKIPLKANEFTYTNHKFEGWANTADGEVVYGDKATISETEPYVANRTLYAKWINENEVVATIVVKGNGGLVNSAEEVTMYLKEEQAITAPKAVRTGYRFTGWTTEDGDSFEFPATCDFIGNYTILANWTPIEYLIVYHSNNSENKVATQSVAYDASVNINANSWTYEGYNFAAWSTTKSGDGINYNPGDVVRNLTDVDNAIVDLYARWNGKQITISYDKNGGSGSMDTKTYTYGMNQTLETKTFSLSRHKFAGWALTSDGDVKYEDNNLVDPIILNEGEGTITLYAKWLETSSAISILYDANGGTINGQVTVTKNIEKGSAFEVLEAKRDGYTHTGYVNKDNEPFTAGQIINVSTVAYATWTENSYTLGFNAKGGTKGSMPTGDHLYTERYELPANTYEKVGYDFIGWDTEEAGTAVVYKDKATVSSLAKSGNVVLYAVWKARTYDIEYRASVAATGTVDNTKFTYNTTDFLNSNTFTYANHRQDGWIYVRQDGTQVKLGLGAQINNETFDITYDTTKITLTASFAENTYTAILRANGGFYSNGLGEKSNVVKFNSPTAFESPMREGYAFTGYTVNGSPLNEYWTYTDAVTYVDANYRPHVYYVVFNPNGGQNSMEMQEVTYDVRTRLNENRFTKDGYSFDGWTLEDGTKITNVVYNLTSIDRGYVTLTANWKPKNFTVNYYGNGAETGSMSSDTVVYGNDYQLKENVFTKSNYDFNGWAVSADTQAIYADKATISSLEAYRKVINLYATWILNSSIRGTLVLEGNGGKVNGVDTYTINLADGEDISIPTLERTGYKFTGWIKDGSPYDLPDVCDFDGTLTLKANWDKIRYNVVYHSNNGRDEEVTESDVAYDQNITTKAANTFTKDFYHFDYWSYSVTEPAKAFAADEVTSKLTTVDRATIHLYAIWAGDKYKITLNGSNPTTGKVASESFVYSENKVIPANAFMKNGHKFSGWTLTEGSDNIDFYNNANADKIYERARSNNINLYAVWTKTSLAVELVFDANGGTIDGQDKLKVTLASGSTITYPTPVLEGYRYVGWLDEDKATPFTKTIVDFMTNKIIYATWSEGTYDIEYVGKNADGGTAMPSENKRYTEEFNLSDNTYQRLGYEFIGWDTSEEGKHVVYGPNAKVSKLAKDGETIKLYTVWDENKYTINYFDDKARKVASSSLLYTGSVRILPNPVEKGTKDKGYIYTYSIGNKKFKSGQTVTINDFEVNYSTTEFDLLGQLEKAIYNIEFDPNGGTWEDGTKEPKTATISNGDKIVWPAAPSYGTRKFNGYKVDGAFYTSDTFDFYDSKAFVADWDKATYKVVFNANVPVSPSGEENVLKGSMATQSFIEGETAKLNNNMYSITGYTFIGWATASYIPSQVEAMRDSGSPLIIPNGADTNLDPGFASVYDYYAMWARNKYKVTLAKNENYNPSVVDPYLDAATNTKEVEVLYDQKLSDISTFADKVRSGYTFTGKFTTKKIPEPMDRKYFVGVEGTDYVTKDYVYRETKDTTLYPLWKNNEYNVTLNIGDGTMPDGYTNMTFIAFYDAPYFTKGTTSEPKYANGTIVSPIATPAATRMLDYWSTDAAGTRKIAGTDLYLDTSVHNLYANYKERRTFYIKFNGNGGQGKMADISVVEGFGITLPRNEFSNGNMVFGGWKGSDGRTYGSGNYIVPSGNLTMSAIWYESKGGRRGGGPGGGGGGGGGGTVPAGGSKAGVIDSIISSMIIGTTGSWVYYPEENKWGYKIPVENEIAKALIKNRDLNTKYILVDDGANVQIKNGLYRITDGILDAYYAFDENGRMLTGFMVTTEDTKTYSINPLTQEVELIGYPGPGKYYLMEAGQYMGGMCTSPITFNNITYIFDQSGKVIMEIKNIIDNAGAWEYKADVNKWVYNKIDADGTITMLKDGVFAIPTLDGIYYYIFDENGYMKTGLTEYNGQTFYLQEEGLLQGAVYTGDLFKDGKVYSFSSTTGELVNIVDAASQVIPIIQ